MKYHNIYNQNPPEPVIIPIQSNPNDDHFEEIIAVHNEEESYETQHIKYFDYVEREYFKELIKNEPKCSI